MAESARGFRRRNSAQGFCQNALENIVLAALYGGSSEACDSSSPSATVMTRLAMLVLGGDEDEDEEEEETVSSPAGLLR